MSFQNPRSKHLLALHEVDKERFKTEIQAAVDQAGNVRGAAKLLDVSERQMWRLVKLAGVQSPQHLRMIGAK